MSGILLFAGKHAEALAACKLARADQEALAAVPGASNDARRELAETVTGIGFLLWRTGKPAAAEPELRTALAIYQKLADGNPDVTEFRRGLASNHFYLSNVLGLTGKPPEAEAELRTALAIIQKLADKTQPSPNSAETRQSTGPSSATC